MLSPSIHHAGKALVHGVLALCAALLAMCHVPAAAQTFPSRPIRFIVPYPAGGGTDTLARHLALAVSEKAGQPVVVENKPGGSTVIAAQALLSSPADGYTVALFDASTVSMNQHLFKKLVYSPSSIAPVTSIARLPLVLVVPNASPYKSLADFVAAAKARPNTILYGSTGAGNPVHLSMERFKVPAGIDVVHVPYKGSAPALQDLVGGQLPSLMVDLPSAMPFIKANQLRVLAVTSTRRSEVLADVPTFAESGYPDFSVYGWNGIFVPAGTSPLVIEALNAMFRSAAASPRVAEWVKAVSQEISTSTPDELATLVKSDADNYGATIKRIGFSLD